MRQGTVNLEIRTLKHCKSSYVTIFSDAMRATVLLLQRRPNINPIGSHIKLQNNVPMGYKALAFVTLHLPYLLSGIVK